MISEDGVAGANRGSMWTANRWCWQQMKRCRAEVIVENSFYGACLFMCNWLAKTWRPKIVVLVQEIPREDGWESQKQRNIYHFSMTLLLRSATLVVANSKYTRQEILSRYPIRTAQVVVLSPVGQQFPGKPQGPAVKEAGAPRLLCVANIRPGKGQKYLVEALHLLDSRDWHLTLVGGVKDDAYYRELLSLIGKYGLTDRIRITGFLEDKALAEQYREAHLLVHPTLGEGYGMVAAEATQWGLPIVASRVGGIPEIVEDGCTGLLVPPGDVSALTRALEQVLSDDTLRERLARAAYARWQFRPTWEEVGYRFEQLLRRRK